MNRALLHLCTVLAMLMLPGVLTAQKFDASHWSYGVYGRSSHLFNTKDVYNLVQKKDYATLGFEASYATHPKDSSWFAQAFNYPTFGLGFSYENMSSLGFNGNSSLGDIYNLYGTARFDIYKTRFFRFGPMLELGPSFTPKRYHPVDNPANIYVGSRVFVLVGVGMEARFLISKHWETGLNAILYHHSNGMMGVPNYGFNEIGGSAFLRYHAGEPYMRQTRTVRDADFRRRMHCDIFASYSVHSCQGEWHKDWREEDPARKVAKFRAWPRVAVTVDGVYRYHPIFASGLGVDFMYTSNVKALRECDRTLHPEEYPALRYCPFYMGISAIQEFRYGNFAAHIIVGAYVFKRLGIEEDLGWSYQRIGFRYYFPGLANTFIGFDMRAHRFDTSDCLEWSIGIRL